MKGINNKVCAIILAAGSGSRMGRSVTKQRMMVLGESILHRSVRAFCNCKAIDSVVVVCREDEHAWVTAEVKDFSKVCAVVHGGKNRAESARKGFLAIPDNIDFVAIHDGARCLVTDEIIRSVIEGAIIHGAATACSYVTDTVKHISSNGFVFETLPRNELVCAQTPQVFKRELYSRAISECDLNEEITDDNMMIERLGYSVYSVDAGKHNIKITTAEDIDLAEFILERRADMSEVRIGHGYDVHRLVEGRPLILGGVNIPFERGLLGHSDADVLLHAVMDSLLGALALGDIGRHFPDSDEKYRGISSLELLREVNALIQSLGYSVVNIDATLIAERPKIAPFIDEMVNNISNILGMENGRINIKATTEEHLGFTGREEGISAHAVASLKKG